MTIANLISKIKTSSSKWIKTKGLTNFYWQKGYGAFSVNPTEIGIVENYILNQAEHHKKKTFKDEYRAFLKKHNVDYNGKYVWD
jgi:hypothetical protein